MKKNSQFSIKRVNIELNLETHTHAKLISILKQITLNDYLKDAVEKAIQKDYPLIKNL